MNENLVYTAIYHDSSNDLIFIWYNDGSKKAFKVKHRFFTPNYGEYNSMPCGMKDIYGNDVYEVIVSGKHEREIYKKIKWDKNYLHEIDIDFCTRWLCEHYKNVETFKYNIKDFNIAFLDIEVETGDRFPVASKADRRVNCVTVFVSKLNKYFTFGLNKDIKPETKEKFIKNGLNVEYNVCETETKLLENLFKKIGESEIDILMAWNGDNFDFPYLINRAKILDVNINLMSRLPTQFKKAFVKNGDFKLKIAGTTVIDHLKLYKKFTMNELNSYKLDDVGYEVTKQRKAELPDGYHSYKNYWDDYVFYNVMDVKLAYDIEKNKKMLVNTIDVCLEARVNFDAIFSIKDVLVGFILNCLHKRGIVLPPLKKLETKPFPGAYVYSTPNYYEWLVSYDYRSMYPSIIMGANISPDTKVEYPIDFPVPDEELNNLVKSPWTANNTKKIFYRKDVEGIIPSVVKKLFNERDEKKILMKKAKKEDNKEMYDFYNMKQNTYKILGNGLYGLLGYSNFHFYDMDNSATVTAFGVKLITETINDYVFWVDNELEKEKKFLDAFGVEPKINYKKYGGFYVNSLGEKCANRLSHGDTDSFFVKYDDIYEPFLFLKDKCVDVLVIKDKSVVFRKRFLLDTEKETSINEFKTKIYEYCDTQLDSMDSDSIQKILNDGIYVKGDVKVIYNTFSLTDFSRVLESVVLEDKLKEIMEKFSKKWNFKENTLFIKREKCISNAIVTAKKKYICLVESNEDIKYKTPEFSITGLEIVRSSSTAFSKKYIFDIILDILKTKDKKIIQNKYFSIKKEFYNLIENRNYDEISIPSGIGSNPPDYTSLLNDVNGKKNIDWRLLSSSVWNYLIETDPILSKMTLEPIYENAKVKFITVFPNKYDVSKIAYVGKNPPSRLFDIFIPDWKTHWDVMFGNVVGRLFEAIGWDKNFEKDQKNILINYM